MFESIESLEKAILPQAKTEESKNLLEKVFAKCKKEKKTPKETFSEVNQIIVNPTNLGVC